jgi:hypothetical protein
MLSGELVACGTDEILRLIFEVNSDEELRSVSHGTRNVFAPATMIRFTASRRIRAVLLMRYPFAPLKFRNCVPWKSTIFRSNLRQLLNKPVVATALI